MNSNSGVAAHWDYKLQNKMTTALPASSTKPLALPPSRDVETNENTARAHAETAVKENIIKHAPDISSKGRIASYIDALVASRERLVKNNVFIFLSSSKSALDGRIVSLNPSSNLVVDVLHQYASDIENSIIKDIECGAIEMYCNGSRISLGEELSNGDVLTLPSAVMDLIQF